MARRTPFLCFVALVGMVDCGLPLHRSNAQGFSTGDPVGIVTIVLPAQSDTRVSMPFVRPARYGGTVQSVAGNVLTVTDTPNWSANQFAFNAAAGQHDTFFVLLGARVGGSGPTPKEGCFYTVTANGTNTLTVDLNGDDLSAVQPGTRVTLIPYWTFGTAFPASDAGRSFVASASAKKLATTILFPDAESSVVDGPVGGYVDPNPPSPPLYYFSGGAWRRKDLSAAVVCDDDVILPNAHFILRNSSTTALAFRPAGTVLTGKFTAPVPAPEQMSRFTYPTALPRPVAVSLNASGLITSGALRTAEQTAADPYANGEYDALAFYDPLATGYNPAPSARYFFSGGAWRKEGASTAQDFGTTALPAGSGVLLYKAPGNGATVFWQNAPNYPAGSNP